MSYLKCCIVLFVEYTWFDTKSYWIIHTEWVLFRQFVLVWLQDIWCPVSVNYNVSFLLLDFVLAQTLYLAGSWSFFVLHYPTVKSREKICLIITAWRNVILTYIQSAYIRPIPVSSYYIVKYQCTYYAGCPYQSQWRI